MIRPQPRMIRSQPFVLAGTLFAAILAACACGSGDDIAASAESAQSQIRFAHPWDLLYVYPEAKTASDRDALLSLADVGLDQSFFDAAFGHMTGRFVLPGTDTDDRPVSPNDPTIVHEDCLRDPNNWRISQVRFAPYELQVPGTVSAYQNWASSHGSKLDRVMQVRLGVHPFCEGEVGPGQLVREDQAMHLVYTIAPNDAALTASVFGSAKAFVAAQLTATPSSREASYAELENHRAALASSAWASFRRDVLSDWATLAQTANLGSSAFSALDTHADSFRKSLLAPFADRFGNSSPGVQPELEHPGLAQAGAPHRTALKQLVQKYARLERLERVALMFTVGSQDPLDDAQQTRWFFSQMTPGAYPRLSELPAGAAAVYGQMSPSLLNTYVAIDNARGVDIVRTTTAGFYSESRGAVSGPKIVYPVHIQLGNKNVTVKDEVDKVDYKESIKLDPKNDDMPLLPSGLELKAAMERFSNVEAANATTTGCDRCHNMQNVLRTDTSTGYRSARREESAYAFHMVTTASLNLRTVRELDADLVKVNQELGSR